MSIARPNTDRPPPSLTDPRIHPLYPSERYTSDADSDDAVPHPCAYDAERILAAARAASDRRRSLALCGRWIRADEIRRALTTLYDHREMTRLVLLNLLGDDVAQIAVEAMRRGGRHG
jgi:hypothetical protein